MIRTYARAQPARRAVRAAVPPPVAVLAAAPRAQRRQPIMEPGLQRWPEETAQVQRTAGNAVVKRMLQAQRVQRAPDDDLKALKKQYGPHQSPEKQNLLKNQMEAVDHVKQHAALFGPAANEISSSILTPEKINQGQFNFCGPNDFLMAIAFKDPVAYVKYLKEIYAAQAAYQQAAGQPGAQVGPQTAKIGNLPVQVAPEIVGENAAALNPGGMPNGITQTDWMSMGALRQATTAAAPKPKDPAVKSIANAFINQDAAAALKLAAANGGNIEQAIMRVKKYLEKRRYTIGAMARLGAADEDRKVAEGAMPGEVEAWFKGYGAVDVEAKADAFNPNKGEKALTEANTALIAGKAVMLNINSDALGAQAAITNYDPLKSHWVLMKTEIVQSGGTGTPWEGEVYSWGRIMRLHIDAKYIGYTFFGHVEAKINTPQSKFNPDSIK